MTSIVPSNFVSENPVKASLKQSLKSLSRVIATASPSLSPSIPSERQCTPAASRPIAILAASLFNSPPTVNAGPTNGVSEKPPLVAATGLGMVKLSLKNALRTVTQAPATQACPAGYDGCAGDPSG